MPAESARINPELELMLCCARTQLDREVSDRRDALLQQDLDWESVLHLTSVHRVVPLVFRNLTSAPPGLLPARALEQLQAGYREAIRSNLFLTAELLRLLKLISANGLDVIPYKGPALAEILYGSVCLRQFGDLDILVRKEQVSQAKELLMRNGYRLEWPEIPLTPAQERAHLEAKYNYKLMRNDGHVAIELHWSISPRYFSFPPDTGWLWQNAVESRLSGEKIRSFGVEDWLLILAVHGANHCWNRLGWVCDVAELLRRFPDLNVERLDKQAGQFGCRRMLHLALLLAHNLLDAPLPPFLQENAFSDTHARALADEILQRCASTKCYVPGVLEVPSFHIRVRERSKDRRRYCVAVVVPSVEDWRALPLPGYLSFLHYLLRPFRLLGAYAFNPLWSNLKRRLGERAG